MTTTAEHAVAPGTHLRGPDRRTTFAWLMFLLAAASWAALWALRASPYGRYVEHGGWGEAGALAALCSAIPQGDIVVPAVLHASAWVLMIAAMMLPTTYPVLQVFRRIVARRPDAGRLAALVIARLLRRLDRDSACSRTRVDTLLLAVARREGALIAYGWVIGAAVLAGAGLFQFSALKYRCLEQCHTPFGFVVARWHGRSASREAFRLGVDHGLFCVGCCWALMLVMFVVGMGSLGWMLVLAAVMAAEKNLPWGRRLRAPLGVGLIGWAAAIVLTNA